MLIHVHMINQALPTKRGNVVNAYTKDNLYCLLLDDGNVKKYPLCNIFEIVEFKKEDE